MVNIYALVGMSIDGKINHPFLGGSSRIFDEIAETDYEARKLKEELRRKSDAIVVGSNTVIVDNPRLYVKEKVVYRVVIDRSLKLSDYVNRINIFLIEPQRTIIVTNSNDVERKEKIEKTGAKVLVIGKNDREFFYEMFSKLRSTFKINNVLVEGGGTLIYHLVRFGILKKFYLVIFPIVIGHKSAVTPVHGQGFPEPARASITNVKLTENGFIIVKFDLNL